MKVARQKTLGWQEWLGIGLAISVLFGVAAILSPTFRAFIANNATAAWVQAIGSISALGVALYLSDSERRHRRAERDQDRSERAQAVAYDVRGVALDLHIRIVQLRALGVESTDKARYLSETLILKDLMRRLADIAKGDAPKAQKNLCIELRRLVSQVLSFVLAKSLSESNASEPDWETWNELANGLYGQAQLSLASIESK